MAKNRPKIDALPPSEAWPNRTDGVYVLEFIERPCPVCGSTDFRIVRTTQVDHEMTVRPCVCNQCGQALECRHNVIPEMIHTLEHRKKYQRRIRP